ncbi:testis development-related protein isoform X1 [Sigmodon hispidus]
MWKLSRNRVLLDEPPEEEDGLRGAQPTAAATPAPTFELMTPVTERLRTWNMEHGTWNMEHGTWASKSPKSKGSNLRLKEELKAEKKSGFWDTLVLKPNIQPKKPDQIEGWEPPKLTAEDVAADAEDGMGGCQPWSSWEDDTKGSTKYTSLANSASSSRWSLRSAGKLVSIRRQSKGHLTDNCEEVE